MENKKNVKYVVKMVDDYGRTFFKTPGSSYGSGLLFSAQRYATRKGAEEWIEKVSGTFNRIVSYEVITEEEAELKKDKRLDLEVCSEGRVYNVGSRWEEVTDPDTIDLIRELMKRLS